MLISFWNQIGFNQNKNIFRSFRWAYRSPKPLSSSPWTFLVTFHHLLLLSSSEPSCVCNAPVLSRNHRVRRKKKGHPLFFPDKYRKSEVCAKMETHFSTYWCARVLGFVFFLHEERRSIRRPNNTLTVLSEMAWLHLVLFGACWMAVSFTFWVFGRYFIFVKLHF